MDIAGTGKRVRIYIGDQDKAEGSHGPLWETILNFLQKHGAAGATMFRGPAGFGAHSRIHMARLADIIPDLPVVIEWIDGAERVDRLLPHVCELVRTGMITSEEVAIIKYTHRAPRPLPPENVEEVMTQEVVAVHPETPLAEAVRMLLLRDYRALPVVDHENRLVGILSNGDLVQRGGLSARLELLGALQSPALERELASSDIRGKIVRDIMTADPISVAAAEHLDRAAHLMVEHRIKRLPVVDGEGRLAGILSRVDVLRTMGEDYASPEQPEREQPTMPRTVGELMRHDVPEVRADAPLGQVLDAVTSTRLNRAIVVDGDRHVLGVVSDADLLARLDPGDQQGLLPALMGRGRSSEAAKAVASDVMRSPATTATAETPIPDAVRAMVDSRRKVLPITDGNGVLLGAVDRSDLLRQGQPGEGVSAQPR
ncbi:MAG: DUF190 domain-containing protein [Chloroflexota bacterium]